MRLPKLCCASSTTAAARCCSPFQLCPAGLCFLLAALGSHMLTPVSPLFPLATADWETNNSAPEQPSTAATTLSETEATVQAEAAADTEGGEPRAVQGLRELLSCLSLAKQLDCFGKHLASFIVPVAMA